MREPFADEARRIVRDEIARRVVEPAAAKLGAVILASGAVAVGLVAWRMARAAEPGGVATAGLATFTALALGVLVGSPWIRLRSARAGVEAEAAAALARARPAECPRCGGALETAAGADGRRRCIACAAPLLEAEGLVIVAGEDGALRRARWRAAARHRLRHVRRPTGLGALAWMGTVGAALLVLTAGARLVGAVALPVPLLEAALGESEETPREGTAFARGADDLAAAGPATRPAAPLWVGTQVLARREAGPWYQLAAVVRVRERRALVVFADGDVAWVGADGLLAPEIAVGDAVERWDGSAFVGGQVEDRVGPAVRVDTTWTAVARLRVRVDAVHARGVGRVSELSADDWVEAVAGDGAWRPGVRVDAEGLRSRIVTSEGEDRWLDHEQVRGQRIGPGTRVDVDGRPGRHVVASRVGHALAVVDARGARRWTALSRVRCP